MRLHDFLDYHARERGDAEFAIQGNRHLTYREALTETNRMANAFVNAGLQIGDRIAALSKNSIEYVLLYFAASKAVVVPVHLHVWTVLQEESGLGAGGHLRAVRSSVTSELR